MTFTTKKCWPRTLLAPALKCGLGGMALGVVCSLAHAASVSHQATDLADVIAGQDLWQLDYTVSGPFGAFDAINVLFAADQYGAISLQSVAPPGSLDTLLIPTNAQLGTDGQLNLSALQDKAASFSAKVSVNVVWLGTAQPGGQPFEWLDADFNVKAAGLTTPTAAVPELPSLALALLGAGLVTWRSRRYARLNA